ncbi:5'-3' exoribonuclease 1 [Thrips palmi]|uniref:5'-3' exoribonuclease 1 n=1 Tax=Thrips palmi TaxID=161013 RepID=A0A6P9AGN0_THRPL|nr:5'-3' exoribonuclease 1 [Thrips palmi]
MGVPKFFRYISERYPCLSELVKEYQIPEFDNLYLDMNGVIHMCSHPNDFDPHFRITEERIFKDIFHYLEVLFQLIKPRKLFFMAVDGVAPRAKMNQQRGRRFRSAKEAEVLEKRAEAKGEKLPKEARFDSNCITPGTVFMARLHEQLKYFVASKMSCDAQWKGVKVILSGHETPGEGEHKIMDYIRWMKTQPGYDPNTRHCLYGLDADLMMLGLCTHEPHFSLLREEVKFGKQSKRITVPEETKFYLLHLSLMREYLGLEFQSLKNKLKFPYDVESIIDDWVLMGFLVGNDFIPHLPDVHIASGALPMLYNAYMEVLPTLDGYINENGYLNLYRFQKFMEKLAAFDLNQFKEAYADMKYFESKTNRKMGSKDERNSKNGEPDHSQSKTGISELDALIKATNEMVLEKFFDEEDGDETVADEEEDDVDVFASRVYDDDSDSEISDTFRCEFHQHKKDYYRNKLEYGKVTEQVLKDQAEGYVRAIQWNLHYYYHGVASWSWYYPHHYAPYVSDICNFKDVSLEFELGEPFKPFEQLLGVLPAASKSLLPAPYRELMTHDTSPILEFYPPEFQTDLNGKKQDWEAVVLIPFIDEKRLLAAMVSCEEKLTVDERNRNRFGPMSQYTFSEKSLGEYNAPEYFPTIKKNHAELLEIWREELRLDHKDIVFGLPPGVRLDVYFPGFPTFKHLPFTGELRKAKVQVFDQPSRGDNMILTLLNNKDISSLSLIDAADQYIGKDVYCGWPHLTEGKVVGVADGTKRYNLLSNSNVALENLSNNLASQCEAVKKGVANDYMRRMGVDIGETQLIVYVRPVAGRKYVFGQAGKITLEKVYSEIETPYAIQTIVDDIAVHDASFVQFKTLEQVFPSGSKCFLLASPIYGGMGEVLEVKKQPEGRLQVIITSHGEPDIEYVRQNQHSMKPQFMTGSKAAQHIGISSHILSRVTGTIFLVVGNKQADNPSKINIGLNLKFNKKNEEVPGYTKKDNNMWLYSRKAIALIREYVEKFPEVFEHLCRKTSDDVYDDKDIYPGEDSAEKVSALSKWLKEIPTASLERQSCGAEVLEEEVVTQLQAVMKVFSENPPDPKKLKLQVKPHVLFRSELRVGNLAPDPTTTYQLFDRIVNVRDDTSVPLGLKGTIIGIRRAEKAADTMYDVLFDNEFESAMSIGGSKGCAYRVSRTAFINISHGFRQGLINETYRVIQPHPRTNSAFTPWAGQGKTGNNQANMSRPGRQQGNEAFANRKPNNSHRTQTNEASSSKKHGESSRSSGFQFPAPPKVQILPKSGPKLPDASNEQLLWKQLQMVSTKSNDLKPSGAPQPATAAPPPATALPIPNQNMTNAIESKTNVLKMMLGVAPGSAPGPTQGTIAGATPGATGGAETVNNPIPAGASHSRQPCELTPFAKDLCGFLLQFFQRKGVGIPLFNFIPYGSDVIAQIKLPDGSTVISKPVPTKQGAADAAAVEALHLLQLCRVCKKDDSGVKPLLQSQPQLSGQPQQFFDQFRQGQFALPQRPSMPPGNPMWQHAHRPTLVRASFPQGPPPFAQAMRHPSNHPLSNQRPPNPQFVQHPQSSYHHQQLPPAKKQHLQPNNQYPRRGEVVRNNYHGGPQNQNQHPQNQQKSRSKELNSFVPLQALKKQRNRPRREPKENIAAQTSVKANEEATVHDTEEKGKGASKGRASTSSEPNAGSTSSGANKASNESARSVSKGEPQEETSGSSRSISRMKKSRLAINFQST